MRDGQRASAFARSMSSGAVCSSIYCVKLGQGVGLMGLEHGGIQVERVGELETKDATRHRIKWYWKEFVG